MSRLIIFIVTTLSFGIISAAGQEDTKRTADGRMRGADAHFFIAHVPFRYQPFERTVTPDQVAQLQQKLSDGADWKSHLKTHCVRAPECSYAYPTIRNTFLQLALDAKMQNAQEFQKTFYAKMNALGCALSNSQPQVIASMYVREVHD